jgi:5-formyltetrahydrofolate cyclo-ligase
MFVLEMSTGSDPGETMSSKAKIRTRIIRLRNAMTREEITAGSDAIVKRLTELAGLRRASTLMVFLSYGSEVLIDDLIRWAWAEGKRVAVPLSNPETRELTPCRIDSFGDLEIGHYGIREPKVGSSNPLPKGEIEVVLVPAVAFDRKGYRVGYGGGYYDRFLPGVPQAAKIGVAFACQIVDGIPADSYDVAVDGLVTEKEIIVPTGPASETWVRRVL